MVLNTRSILRAGELARPRPAVKDKKKQNNRVRNDDLMSLNEASQEQALSRASSLSANAAECATMKLSERPFRLTSDFPLATAAGGGISNPSLKYDRYVTPPSRQDRFGMRSPSKKKMLPRTSWTFRPPSCLRTWTDIELNSKLPRRMTSAASQFAKEVKL